MSTYRVRVESYVVVEARSIGQAKERAEVALRKAVAEDYRRMPERLDRRWADDWQLFAFEAKKAERLPNDGA